MSRQKVLVLICMLLVLMFVVVPGASAACGDAAAPGVDWSGCDKSNLDLTAANLSGADLSGTDFSGSNLTSANLSGATVNATNFTGAILNDALLTNVLSLIGSTFDEAQINNLDFSSSFVSASTFNDAVGIPIVSAVSLFATTNACPDGTAASATSPYCTWVEPTAVSLRSTGAAAVPAASSGLWIAAALLLLAATGLLVGRRVRGGGRGLSGT